MTNRTQPELSKRLLLMLLLCSGVTAWSAFSGLIALSPVLAVTPASSMRWGHDLRSSLDKAHESNKLILLDIYKDRCKWCEALDRAVYSDPQVSSYLNSTFICVRINSEDPTLGSWVKTKYDVQENSFPAILLLKDKETVVGRINGFEPKDQFLAHIRMFEAQAQHSR